MKWVEGAGEGFEPYLDRIEWRPIHVEVECVRHDLPVQYVVGDDTRWRYHLPRESDTERLLRGRHLQSVPHNNVSLGADQIVDPVDPGAWSHREDHVLVYLKQDNNYINNQG